MKLHKRNDILWEQMKADCIKCSALCCTALFFSKMDGFPKDKVAGEPCIHLRKDYHCRIHSQLETLKMKGCIGYECFGAGQQVMQVTYQTKTWRDIPNQATEIFDIYIIMFQLYQIRYYLIEALTLIPAQSLETKLQCLIEENIQLCQYLPDQLLSFDIKQYRDEINKILKQVCQLLQQFTHPTKKKIPNHLLGANFKNQDLSGHDLSAKLLIAANFEKCLFDGTNFLGADTRDANFKGADLSETIFLT